MKSLIKIRNNQKTHKKNKHEKHVHDIELIQNPLNLDLKGSREISCERLMGAEWPEALLPNSVQKEGEHK